MQCNSDYWSPRRVPEIPFVNARKSTVDGHKSVRFAYTIMRPPGTPRQPLREVSPNTRSRVVGARDHGTKFRAISRLENLDDSTCRKIYKNASH